MRLDADTPGRRAAEGGLRGGGHPDRVPRPAASAATSHSACSASTTAATALAGGGGGAGPGVRRPGGGRDPERASVSVRRRPGGPHALDPGPLRAPQPPDRCAGHRRGDRRRGQPRWPTTTTSASTASTGSADLCDPIAFTREMLDGDPDDAEDLLRVEIGEGFTGWVAEHGEPLLINDALDDERGKTIDGTEDVPESMLVVPMLYEGRALGVIVLSQLGFNRFSDDDLQTMSIFAGYAAQAMANATTLRAAGRRSPPSSRAAPTRSAACSRSTSASSRRSTRPTCSRRSPTACETSWPTTTCRSTGPTRSSRHAAGADARAPRRAR